jgi:hypothetical protein
VQEALFFLHPVDTSVADGGGALEAGPRDVHKVVEPEPGGGRVRG